MINKNNSIILTFLQSTLLSLIFCLFPLECHSVQKPSQQKLHTLYNSLDPNSLSQHLAFYELYPNTQEGLDAYKQAWELLLSITQLSSDNLTNFPLSFSGIEPIIALVNKEPNEASNELSNEDLIQINKLSSKLNNRKLKGFYAQTEQDVLALEPYEIDLARGLFISQFSEEPDSLQKIHHYEAMVDMMALQILIKLPPLASDEQKIRAINYFIFEEMRFRFPPHSVYANDVDVYTFLPSVLDSRRGVCLGVSVLYLCIAQRVGLTLEMITPPGHIYVRYNNNGHIINIETTARGINLPSKDYLGIETKSLQQRNIKEVIGLTYFNQASTFWHHKEHEQAIKAYQVAQKYLPEDKLLIELLAYNHLFAGQEEKGKELLKKVQGHVPDHAIVHETLCDEYLSGIVDLEGIKAYFMQVDESRESIIEKRAALEDAIIKNPRFSNGYFALAIAWLQLHRQGEALEMLRKFHLMDPNQPTAEYYLSVLHAQRKDYNKAWEHLRNAEKITLAKQHDPEVLKELRKELSHHSPE